MIGTMRIMDHRGDTKLMWDSDRSDEVSTARRTFGDLKKKGYVAFRVDPGGERGVLMSDFDPSAQKMILTPPLSGG